MNEVTPKQVVAALQTAGQKAVAPVVLIATALSSQLAATSAVFSQIPFGIEPDTFAVLLRQES